jgi:hypothetical protein
MKINSIGGMKLDAMKGMMASQPNAAEGMKALENMTLKLDSDSKNLFPVSTKGDTGPNPILTKE